jgi:hypothetical protein
VRGREIESSKVLLTEYHVNGIAVFAAWDLSIRGREFDGTGCSYHSAKLFHCDAGSSLLC